MLLLEMLDRCYLKASVFRGISARETERETERWNHKEESIGK